ncbi:hypothetical protein [Marinobacter subterrani]|uniref:Uncharacterized protein n=1 Tax=Marinobacter subterrani TaxID=1658765 RepID=A0A0J7M4R3_9GAMM|nr:hypothetical protein [Marinobacter subterrani]KMQ75960.1 hypothetical protein Msub_12169 [Marinobacter subterrani]
MFKRTFNSGLAATVLCASVLLSACGGGGGSGSSGGSASPASSDGDATTLKAGLYKAKVLYLNGNPQQTATIYLSPTGKFAAVFGGNSGLTLGNLDFANTRITGTSSDYRQPDPKGFFEDKGVEDGTITGTITSQGSATFSTSDAKGQVDTNVTLQRQNALSDLGISLGRASGTYVASPDVFLNISSDGSLYAEHYTLETGCRFEGTDSVSVPDASINVFNITYTMSNCNDDNHNGEYSGVGFFGPAPDGRMQMIFAAHNGIVAMKFEGIK